LLEVDRVSIEVSSRRRRRWRVGIEFGGCNVVGVVSKWVVVVVRKYLIRYQRRMRKRKVLQNSKV